MGGLLRLVQGVGELVEWPPVHTPFPCSGIM